MKSPRKFQFLVKLGGRQDTLGVDLASELLVQPVPRPRSDLIRVAVKVKRNATNSGGEPTLFRGCQGVFSQRRGHKNPRRA